MVSSESILAWADILACVSTPWLDWPAGHSLQCEAPVGTPDPSESELESVAKFPAEHVMQSIPFRLNWPAGQLSQLSAIPGYQVVLGK